MRQSVFVYVTTGNTCLFDIHVLTLSQHGFLGFRIQVGVRSCRVKVSVQETSLSQCIECPLK